jgi:hypothetical protein
MDKVVTHGNLSGAANGACTLIREALDIWGKYERQEPSYRAYHAGILKKLVRHPPGIFPDPLDSRGAPPSWDLGLVLGFGCPPWTKSQEIADMAQCPFLAPPSWATARDRRELFAQDAAQLVSVAGLS